MPVVCGTDFSESARAALKVAAVTAGVRGAELWLVHVLDPAVSALEPGAQVALEAIARKRLEQEAAQLRQGALPRVQPVVLSGPAVDTLLAFAESKKAGLLVVASQGHSASPLYRVGGTSERLAQAARVPVLVVRDAAPFEAWASGERPLRILLAVDWTASCDAAIRWVKALRRSRPCDVVVGNVYYSNARDGALRYGLPQRYGMVQPDPGAEPLLARDLATRVGEMGGQGDVVFRPMHGVGRLGDHLLDLAEMERADLIVVGTHHRRGLARLSSVAGVTLHYSRTAVAIVPVPDGERMLADEVPVVRRVLVATDLSPLSNHAVASAYALVRDGGEVHLFHAIPNGRDLSTDADVAARLRALVPSRGVAPTIATRTEVVHHTNVSRAICEAAERVGADVICMSTHGRTGLKRAILGSVTESVLRESRRPVFVVRPPQP